MDVSALSLFLVVPWVGLQCVIVVFPGVIRTHFSKNDVDSNRNHLQLIVIAYVPLSCAGAILIESTCLL